MPLVRMLPVRIQDAASEVLNMGHTVSVSIAVAVPPSREPAPTSTEVEQDYLLEAPERCMLSVCREIFEQVDQPMGNLPRSEY